MLAVALYAGETEGMDDGMRGFLRWASCLIAIPVVAYSGWPFLRNAWLSLRQRMPGMDVPVSVAILLAFLASAWATVTNDGEVYFDSVSMFIFFLLGGLFEDLDQDLTQPPAILQRNSEPPGQRPRHLRQPA